MSKEETKSIINELIDMGINITSVERHLNLKTWRLRNCKFDSTSLTDEELSNLREYRDSAKKLSELARDDIIDILDDLNNAGFKNVTVENHLNLATHKINNYRHKQTSLTHAERTNLVKYHKAAMKLAGK